MPFAVSGHIRSGDGGTYNVSSTWSQRDLERMEKIKTQCNDVISVDETMRVLLSSSPVEVTNE